MQLYLARVLMHDKDSVTLEVALNEEALRGMPATKLLAVQLWRPLGSVGGCQQSNPVMIPTTWDEVLRVGDATSS